LKRVITILLSCICYGVSAQNWEQVGLGALNAGNLTTDSTNNLLYATGNFISSSGNFCCVAKWDGTSWDSLSPNVSSPSTLAIHNSELYVGGNFDSVGSLYTNNIVKWNGSVWDSLGNGTSAEILGLHSFNNELYAVGMFGSAGGINATQVAKWNGVSWDSVGPPAVFLAQVVAVQDYQGEVYIGGTFASDSGSSILRWNGTTWRDVGGGLNGSGPAQFVVETLEKFNGELFVGGSFTKSDGDPGNYIARWNGSVWSDIGGGTNGKVKDMVVYNGDLYAVGFFTEAGGIPAQGIAKWDGSEWCGLGSVFSNGGIYSIEVYNNELIVGGTFDNIDGDTIVGVAKWIGGNVIDTCGVYIGVNNLLPANATFSVYPNPATGQITITDLPQEATRITIYNALGALINDIELNGSGEPEIDLSAFPDGMYLIQLQSDHKLLSKKVMKQ